MEDFRYKTKQELLKDLERSINVVKVCVKEIKLGNNFMFIPLCGQLRSLVAGNKGKQNISLLLYLISKSELNTKIFALSDITNFPESLPQPDIHIQPDPLITLERKSINQKEFEIKDFINDYKIALHTKDVCSIRDIIDIFSNNIGGSHYSVRIHNKKAKFLYFSINNKPVFVDTIIKIAELVVELGQRVINKSDL